MPQKFSADQLAELIRAKKAEIGALEPKEAFDSNVLHMLNRILPDIVREAHDLRSGKYGEKGSDTYETKLKEVVSGNLRESLKMVLEMIHADEHKGTGYATVKACSPSETHRLFDGMEKKLAEAAKDDASLVQAFRTANFMNALNQMVTLMFSVQKDAGAAPGTRAQDLDPAVRTKLTNIITFSKLPAYLKFFAGMQLGAKQVLASMLDKIATELEQSGHKDLAQQVDVVTNSLEHDAAGLSVYDLEEPGDRNGFGIILTALKSENDHDTHSLEKFMENPVEFLKVKGVLNDPDAAKAASLIKGKIDSIRTHLVNGAKSLASFGWDKTRDFLQAEFGGLRLHTASSADNIQTVAEKIHKGFRAAGLHEKSSIAKIVTELMVGGKSYSLDAVGAQLFFAAGKGGATAGELEAALSDPKTLAEDLNKAANTAPAANTLYTHGA